MRTRPHASASIAGLSLATVMLSLGSLWLQPTDPAETIKRLEEQRRKEQGAPAPVTPPAQSPSTPATPAAPAPRPAGDQPAAEATTGNRLLRENTFITSRRGRMTRSLTNEWVFTFDADAKGRADLPMVLMPCMNLQNMEKAVERTGEGTSFSISGTVYVYKGRNYLLPTMYIVNRRTDLAPAQ